MSKSDKSRMQKNDQCPPTTTSHHPYDSSKQTPSIQPRRSTTLKRLPILFEMLVVISIVASFQGTHWSTTTITSSSLDASMGGASTAAISGSGIAPARQEAALRSIVLTNATKTGQAVSQPHIGTTSQIPSAQTTTTSTTTSTSTSQSTRNSTTFAACLLIKDDNDILNEWIAYHYHVLNLRSMIVATDPFSQTSPSQLLEQWRQPPFGISILEWKDDQYMPDYFLQGHYDQVPSFIPADFQKNPKSSIWHRHDIQNSESPSNISVQEIKEDLEHINNHRFRQATFVSHCFRHYQQQQKRGTQQLQHNQKEQQQQQHKWVIHTDTDEYLVINPRLRARPRAVKDVTVPVIPHAGSVVQFLQDMYHYYPKRLLPSCLMMPTILFGATENNNATLVAKVPPGWERTRFESLRWTYHADLQDIANGLQKAIVDVATLPDDHPIFVTQLIKSVHQPLDRTYDHWTQQQQQQHSNKNGTTTVPPFKQTCRPMTLKPDVDAVRLFPLTTNHYVGSLERYTAREDLRRNLDIYHQKATVHGGVDDGWIQGWLASFVDTHGVEASRRVLGEYYRYHSSP